MIPRPPTASSSTPSRSLLLGVGIACGLFALFGVPSLAFAHEVGPCEEGFVKTDDGVRLYYRVIGSGDQSVIVPLVHWNLEAFEQRTSGRRFIFYDPRSRGRSDASEAGDVSLEKDLSDLDAVRRFFGLDKISIIGTSYYGALAIQYADRHPERVDNVLAVGPMSPLARLQMGYSPEEAKRRVTPEDEARLEALAEELEGQGGRNSIAYCREYWAVQRRKSVGRPDPAGSNRQARAAGNRCLLPNEWPPNIFGWAGALFGSLGDWDWSEVGANVTARTLIIHGDTDLIAPLEGSHRWLKAIPGARLLILEGGGHVPWIGMPETIFPIVETFLGGDWPAMDEQSETAEPP